MFNTLKNAKILEEAGASIKILVEIMEDKLATKQDIEGLKQALQQSKLELTIRMGTMLAASIAVVTALNKLL